MRSPLTNKSNALKIYSFSVEKIIACYRDLGIDVSSYFENVTEVDLYKCKDTGYRFYTPFKSIGDANFYDDLSKNRKNYYSHRWEHNIAISYIDNSDSVLEVGSGFGAFLGLLKQKKIQAKGLELNPHAIQNCKSQGLHVEEKMIQQEAIDQNKAYSVVCYFQVLEHITEVYDFIKDSLDTLKKEGKLIIGVPNNNPYLFIRDKYHTLNLPPHHAGLWNKKSLRSLENIFPLKLESIQFEPLSKSYSYFLDFHINNSSVFIKIILKTLNNLAPRVLRKVICKFIKGRNVLVVFKKTI